jgi:hypothetical protein
VLFDRYYLCDMAIKVVGIGSVGTMCAIGLWIVAENDPFFLQIKEARARWSTGMAHEKPVGQHEISAESGRECRDQPLHCAGPGFNTVAAPNDRAACVGRPACHLTTTPRLRHPNIAE